ncbi:hypothetical protein J2S66_002933 [Saccharothrix longispora]|uniref:Uncharacterized protein n=1 Tax=Saccharothrix longispora TaxID=33920 RepID=A0ABU1PWL8_9PSEU|nr:hypothetical protein [Saccharothrix longispora]
MDSSVVGLRPMPRRSAGLVWRTSPLTGCDRATRVSTGVPGNVVSAKVSVHSGKATAVTAVVITSCRWRACPLPRAATTPYTGSGAEGRPFRDSL